MTPRAAAIIAAAAEDAADELIADRQSPATDDMSAADRAAHDAATYIRPRREG